MGSLPGGQGELWEVLEQGVLSAVWDDQRMGIPWGTLRRHLDMWFGLEVGLWVLWWMDGM